MHETGRFYDARAYGDAGVCFRRFHLCRALKKRPGQGKCAVSAHAVQKLRRTFLQKLKKKFDKWRAIVCNIYLVAALDTKQAMRRASRESLGA